MRYFAHVNFDSQASANGQDYASACVSPSKWTGDEVLALRHARAMASVLRAARAVQSSACALNRVQTGHAIWQAADLKHGSAFDRCAQRFSRAKLRLANATERLVAIEKKVGRG